MQAEYPQSIKDFGSDVIDGDYLLSDHINALRAEVKAIQTALGIGLGNTLSAGSLQAAGDLITATAPGVLARLAIGADGQVLGADNTAETGLRWVNPPNSVDPFTPRVESQTSGATLTPTASDYEHFHVTDLAENAIFAAPNGGALDGKKLLIRVKDNGTSRALTWNTAYTPIGVSLPTATSAGKTHYIGAIYNTRSARWDVIAVGVEG